MLSSAHDSIFSKIAESLKQPVVTIALGAITVIGSYAVTAATTKTNTTTIEQMRLKQEQFDKDSLTREEFYRESLRIREDIKQVREAQVEANKHLDEYIMRKDVRNAAH